MSAPATRHVRRCSASTRPCRHILYPFTRSAGHSLASMWSFLAWPLAKRPLILRLGYGSIEEGTTQASASGAVSVLQLPVLILERALVRDDRMREGNKDLPRTGISPWKSLSSQRTPCFKPIFEPRIHLHVVYAPRSSPGSMHSVSISAALTLKLEMTMEALQLYNSAMNALSMDAAVSLPNCTISSSTSGQYTTGRGSSSAARKRT